MIDTILEPIYTTQKYLDKTAHHNLQEYVENAHQHVQEMAEKYGFTVRYGTREGGHESAFPLPSPTQSSDSSVEASSHK